MGAGANPKERAVQNKCPQKGKPKPWALISRMPCFEGVIQHKVPKCQSAQDQNLCFFCMGRAHLSTGGSTQHQG
jgi:hypothetical protein